jgi:hypothetical protein
MDLDTIYDGLPERQIHRVIHVSECHVVAICDDNTLWKLCWAYPERGWVQLPMVPGTEVK